MKLKKYFLILVVPLLFFVFAFFTLSDYGISWDEPIHFQRGQAYLYYFLTGKLTYTDLPVIKDYEPKIEGLDISKEYPGRQIVSLEDSFRRSYFQNETINGEWFLANDSGHPPLNGELAALFNKIFYQDLNVLGDIESYHLFIVVAATILVFVVCFFAYQTYGSLVAIISGITLGLYPLFFAESHFNIKDPPETAFFALTIWAFWQSLNKKSWKWMILTAISFGFALGTKFNILFLPVILVPYLIIRYWSFVTKNIKRPFYILSRVPMTYWFALIGAPLIVAVIFFGSWPYLWQDLWGNTLSIFKFYKDIGTASGYQPNFILSGGINSYPAYWIITTTPIWMLVLTICGIVYSFKHLKKHNFASALWLLWFFVPIIRVSWPGTSVYGGIRQIMEYIPAMALLSGLGGLFLVEKLNSFFKRNLRVIETVVCILTFSFMFYPILVYHPNENVYFNALIGGLKGATQENVPSAGNSFGNAYYQAVAWMNRNLEKDAKLVFVQGTLTNIPSIYLRPDIKLWNGYWTAIDRGGEYLVELTYDGSEVAYPYAWDYVNRFLTPVYEVKVDGVAIAKVWKNDLAHTKPEYRKDEKLYSGRIDLQRKGNIISVKFADDLILSHITLRFNKNKNCTLLPVPIYISEDGQKWIRKGEDFLSHQINSTVALDGNIAHYYFAGDKVRYIRIETNNDSCLLNVGNFSATILQ